MPPEEPLDKEHYQEVQDNLLNRMAKNYVNMLLAIEDSEDNKAFFKRYFDIIAQAVFYSYFYSFPKSRSEFNDELKKDLIDEFSVLFTGILFFSFTPLWVMCYEDISPLKISAPPAYLNKRDVFLADKILY